MSFSQLTLGQQPAVMTKLDQSQHLGPLLLDEINYIATPSFKVCQCSTGLYKLTSRQPSFFPLPIEPVLALTLFCFQAHEPFDAQHIQKEIRHWLAVDDVFQPAFLRHVVIISAHKSNDALNRHLCDEIKRTWRSESCTIVSAHHFLSFPAQGPYFWISNSLHVPYRLYDDVQDAFIVAVKPNSMKR